MPQLIVEPGFEDGGVFWTLTGLAAVVTAPVHSGTRSLRLRGRRAFNQNQGSTAQPMDLLTTIGDVVTVRAWVNSDLALPPAGGQLDLTILADDGSGGLFNVQPPYPPTAGLGWRQVTFAPFIALGPICQVVFQALPSGTGTWQNDWFLDDLTASVPALVAVELGERVVRRVIAALQSLLPAELALIDAERADGIALDVPLTEAYYGRPRSDIHGPPIHVEVFESAIDFTNPYADADAQRATYDCPFTVRVTQLSRRGEGANIMRLRAQRAGAAVFRVFNKNPSLLNDDQAIKISAVRRVRSHYQTEGEDSDKVEKIRTTLECEAKCEEVHA